MDHLANIVAGLKAAGIQVKSVTPCEERVDGGIVINDVVSISVATDGTYAGVTHQSAPGVFDRTDRAADDIDGLISDVKAMMAGAYNELRFAWAQSARMAGDSIIIGDANMDGAITEHSILIASEEGAAALADPLIRRQLLTPITRGGTRPGAGRKPIGAEPMKMFKIYLAPGDVERAQAIGDGNVSAGVRKALEMAAATIGERK